MVENKYLVNNNFISILCYIPFVGNDRGQTFSVSLHNVTLVLALCRSFTRSPRVVLGFLLTVLVIILTPRGEILRGAPDRGRLSVVLYVFHFLIIAPTVDFFTPSCLPIADSVFPAWCGSTILFLVSFDSSLVLAIVEFGV